jgi:uncharacterized protein
MRDFGAALGLVLVLEGLVWAAFPNGMRQAMAQALEAAPATLRTLGLGAAVVGLLLIWVVRWALE